MTRRIMDEPEIVRDLADILRRMTLGVEAAGENGYISNYERICDEARAVLASLDITELEE